METLKPLDIGLDGARLVEASAGTGKTFNLVTLYLRLIVEEGLAVSEILVVTYTNAAAAELRQRIRDRLRDACAQFEGSQLPGAGPSRAEGSILEQLAEASHARGEIDRDLARLVAALRSFDEAAISTIHGFCEGVLQENAFESGVAFGTTLVKNDSLLLNAVVEDFWTRSFYAANADFVRWIRFTAAAHSVKVLGKLAAAVFSPPGIRVLPAAPTRPSEADIQKLEADWHAAFDAARSAWREDADEVLALMLDAATREILKKGTYGASKVTDSAWRADVDRVFARAVPGEANRSKSKYVNFTQEKINKGTRKAATSPTHRVFDAFEAFARADQEYVAFFEGEWLNLQVELVSFVREEVARRQREGGIRTFDRVLTDFADALDGPSGDALAENVLKRHPAALIDEFQDTDPIQYRIFQRIWGESAASFFMIGDPKQAIYGFRGADIYAYMEAKRGVRGGGHTLDRNWRSEPKLISAVNAIFKQSPSPFLFDEIPFHEAKAPKPAESKLGTLCVPEDQGAPLRFLLLERDEDPSRGNMNKAKKSVPRAIAGDIARLLRSGAVIEPWAGSSAEPRPLGAGDVAVLCRTKDWGKRVSEALSALRIPSVLQVDASVFETAEAAHFQALLDSVADPSDARALRVFLATPLIDLKAEEFLALRDNPVAWEHWLVEARAWQACLQRGGVIAGFQKILNDHGGQQRLLSWRDGERRLTNYLHLAELLHQASKSGGLGPRALHAWLERMRVDAAARDEEASDDALVRLESDANAVQILTIHKSKGLQFPVVYCPDLWSGMILGKEDPGRPRFHDPDDDHRLKLDMGTPQRDAAVNQMRWERLAENRRMLYVALTRAEHRLVVVWGGFKDAGSSALGLLLHPPLGIDEFEASRSDELEKDSRKELKSRPDAELRKDLQALAVRVPGAISVEPLLIEGTAGEALAPGPLPELSPRVAERKISSRWRVSSFSGLVAGATAQGQGRSDSHPASQGLDYDDPGAAASEPVTGPAEPRVLLHGFPAGTGPGTMIHAVFERIDFALSDPEQLPAEVRRALERYGLGAEHESALCDGIRQVVRTPLAGPLGAFSLADLQRVDRVDEMGFTLPVLHVSGRLLTPSDLAQAFETHGKAPALREYAERLGALDFPPLEGHLRGFIDLTFRHQGRFYLADYKSNKLGQYPADYGAERLADQMREHDYVLQYHLYTVALHRYLSRRLPGYDYDAHMGGAYYLFLRGMSPDYPDGSGIFYDRPPRELIEALSVSLGDSSLEGEAP